MRKIIIPLLLLSCSPSKTDQIVKIDIYCNYCWAKIENGSYYGNQNDYNYISEISFDGNISGYQSISINRYEGLSCIRMNDYNSQDTVHIYFIENNDTIYQEHNTHRIVSYCH